MVTSDERREVAERLRKEANGYRRNRAHGVRTESQAIHDWFLEVKAQESLPDDELTPCSPEQRWHKPDKWAVVKDGNKRATRVFENEDDAEFSRILLEDTTGKKHHIEFREGEDTKCDSYCPVSDFCPFARAKKSDACERQEEK